MKTLKTTLAIISFLLVMACFTAVENFEFPKALILAIVAFAFGFVSYVIHKNNEPLEYKSYLWYDKINHL